MSRSVRLLIVCLAVAWHVLAMATMWPKALKADHARDFASYYYAADVVRDGGDPYDRALLERTAHADRTRSMVYPYLYPPPFLFAVSWAPSFSLKTAYLAWFWFNEVALALAVAALARWWRKLPGEPTLVLLGVVALATAVPNNHWMGQANLPVMALALAGLWQDHEERSWLGGVLLGLAVVLKGSPAILVLWWVLRGRWKAVLSAGLTGAVALTASVLVFGWLPMQSFLFDVLPTMRSGYYN
ncbi:MAG: glycosyltransferase family 87 protein, partial [Myxococcota bacterium]